MNAGLSRSLLTGLAGSLLSGCAAIDALQAEESSADPNKPPDSGGETP